METIFDNVNGNNFEYKLVKRGEKEPERWTTHVCLAGVRQDMESWDTGSSLDYMVIRLNVNKVVQLPILNDHEVFLWLDTFFNKLPYFGKYLVGTVEESMKEGCIRLLTNCPLQVLYHMAVAVRSLSDQPMSVYMFSEWVAEGRDLKTSFVIQQRAFNCTTLMQNCYKLVSNDRWPTFDSGHQFQSVRTPVNKLTAYITGQCKFVGESVATSLGHGHNIDQQRMYFHHKEVGIGPDQAINKFDKSPDKAYFKLIKLLEGAGYVSSSTK